MLPLTGEAKREYQRQWVANRRARGVELLGGRCNQCEATENLEFDHIDPSLKTINLGHLWSSSWEKINAELAKCQLLCQGCHKVKTAKSYPEIKHGSTTMYGKRKCRCEPCKKAWNESKARYRANGGAH